jgi:ribosomal peptide maturation radical SAM protein 1
MRRIVLVNMPFANVAMPSIALTQLKYMLDTKFPDQVSVEVIYLNQDFATALGLEFYKFIAESADATNAGLGDWFFRQTAFPDLPDNSEAYFRRYFSLPSASIQLLRRQILEKRERLDSLMDALIKKWALDEADLLGATTMFSQNLANFGLARKVKKLNPRITTVIGGANCETPMGQEIAKDVTQFDFVFSGPALISFPEFIGHWLNGEIEKCHSIKGVFSKRNCQLQTGRGAIGEELPIDQPIDLNYRGFLEALAGNFPNREVAPILLFETSRGCWWGERAHCTFCGLNGESMAYRAMSPDRAIEQFQNLFRYSDSVAQFDAVDNILPKNYLSQVLPKIDTPPHARLFYEVKADLSKDDIQVLAKARVKHIQPGIESLATSTLKLMKKGTTAFQNLLLLRGCATYGITPLWNLLVGFPGEGQDVYERYVECLPFLAHLPPPTDVFPVRFDRYSPYFVQADHYQLDLYPLDFYSLIYPFDDRSLMNLAYFFADQNLGAKYMMDMLLWIGRIKKEVMQWVGRWRDPAKKPPMLFFMSDSSDLVIHDSRFDAPTEHRLSQTGLQLLRHLEQPKRIKDLERELSSDISGTDISRELAALQSKGLLFTEGDHFLSLVLDKGPAEPA